MFRKKGFIFGHHQYFLPHIKDQEGIEHLNSDLDELKKCQFLSHPVGDTEYAVKAYLSRTELEFRDFDKQFSDLLKSLYNKNYLLSVLAHSRYLESEAKRYYEVDLSQLGQFSFEYWVKLLAQSTEDGLGSPKEELIASILIANDVITIFTEKPIFLKGLTRIRSLEIFSTEKVRLETDLYISEKLIIHAESLHIEPQHVSEINAKEAIFYCEQACNLKEALNVTSLMVKAGEFYNQGTIEAQQRVQIICEQGHQQGHIYAREAIGIVSLSWVDSPTSHLHSPGTVAIMVKNNEYHGGITTNHFFLDAYIADFQEGDIYSAKQTVIQTDRCLNENKNVRFILNGGIRKTSKWSAFLDGCIFQRIGLKVGWKKIIDPNMAYPSQRCLRRAPVLENQPISYFPLLHYSLDEIDNGEVTFLAPGLESPMGSSRSPSLALSLLPEDQIEQREEKRVPSLSLNADMYLHLSGSIVAENMDISIRSANWIQLAGNIWQRSFWGEKHTLFLETQTLDLSGEVTVSNCQANVKKDFLQSGKLVADVINVAADNYQLQESAIVQGAEFNVLAQENVVIEEKSQLTISQKSAIQCRTIENRGLFNSGESFYIEASGSIYKSWQGDFAAKKQYYVAPFFISVGRINAEDLSVNTYGSILLGFIPRCRSANVNSLVSLTPLVTVQRLLVSPNPMSLLMAGVNVGFLVLNAFMPALLPVTVPAQLFLNTAWRLKNSYHMLEPLQANFRRAFHQPSTCNVLRAATTVNQALALSVYTGSSLYSSFQHVGMAVPVQEAPHFIPLAQQSAAYLAASFGGMNNFSLINLNPLETFVGISATHYNFISISPFQFRLSLSFVDNSIISVDGSFNATLLCSSTNSFRLRSMGETEVLFGQYAINCEQLTLSPLLHTDHRNWNVQANTAHLENQNHFKGSVFSVDELDEKGQLVLEHSQIKFINGNVNQAGELICNDSQVKFSNMVNNGGLQFINSIVEGDDITNGNGAHFAIDSSQVRLRQLDNRGGGEAAARYSHLNIDNLKNEDKGTLVTKNSLLEGNVFTNNGSLVTGNCLWNYSQVNGDLTEQCVLAENSVFYMPSPPPSTVGGNEIRLVRGPNVENALNILGRDVVRTIVLQKYHHQMASGFDLIRHRASDEEIKQFSAEHPVLQAAFLDGRLIYYTPTSLTINNDFLVTLVPMTFVASEITVAGLVKATADLMLQSSGDIHYHPGQITVTHGGLTVLAQNKFFCEGTQIEAEGDVAIIGMKGVVLSPQIIWKETHETRWRWAGLRSGIETTTTRTATVILPRIISEHGKAFVSDPGGGGIMSIGTDVIAKSIDFYALNAPITLLDVAGISEQTTSTRWSLLGHSREEDSEEKNIPSHLLSQSNVKLIADGGDLRVNGVLVFSPGDLVLKGLNVDCSRSILHSHDKKTETSFAISNPLFSGQFDPKAYVPLAQATQLLDEDNNNLAGIFNESTFLINQGHKLSTGLLAGIPRGQVVRDMLLPCNALAQLLSARLSLGTTKTEINRETLGSGGITAGNVSIEAAESIRLDNAFGIDASGTLSMRAPQISMAGAVLETDIIASQRSMGVDVNLIGIPGMTGASISGSDTQIKQIEHVAAQIHSHRTFIETKDLRLDDAQLSTEKITGRVDNLTIVSEKNSTEAKTSQMGLDMRLNSQHPLLPGTAGFSSPQSHHETWADSKLDAKDASQFTVGKLTMPVSTAVSQSIHAESTTIQTQSPLINSEDHLAVNVNLRPLSSCEEIFPTLFDITKSSARGNDHHNFHLLVPGISSEMGEQLEKAKALFFEKSVVSDKPLNHAMERGVLNEEKNMQRPHRSHPSTHQVSKMNFFSGGRSNSREEPIQEDSNLCSTGLIRSQTATGRSSNNRLSRWQPSGLTSSHSVWFWNKTLNDIGNSKIVGDILENRQGFIDTVEHTGENLLHPWDNIIKPTANLFWDAGIVAWDTNYSDPSVQQAQARMDIRINNVEQGAINLYQGLANPNTRWYTLGSMMAGGAFVYSGDVIAMIGEGMENAGARTMFELTKSPDPLGAITRQEAMLRENVGYNISPTSWFVDYPTIGSTGTYLTDYQAVVESLGFVRPNQAFRTGLFTYENQVSFFRARSVELNLGLESNSLNNGFRFSSVTGINQMPLLPLENGSNQYFLGAGQGLPNGGPEIKVESLPTSPWPWNFKM